jgi:hypothetical protein
MKNKKLSVVESECDCEMCSSMCHGPCSGTPEDMEKLIDRGFGNRLSYDDWEPKPYILKPSLKGYEGKKQPWHTRSEEGCTFWKDGKCELHNLGLKPTQGKLERHDSTIEQSKEIQNMIIESWDEENENVKRVIDLWKKINKQNKIEKYKKTQNI